MATLCGNNPDTCFYKYGGSAIGSHHCHEQALRLILHQARTVANKCQKTIEPVLSLSIDFYVRLFFRVVNSAEKCKTALIDTSLLLQCAQCPAFYLQPLGRVSESKLRTRKDKKTGEKLPTKKGGHPKIVPARMAYGSNCSECGGELNLCGPIYNGPLHSSEFITEMLETLDRFDFEMSDRIKGMLTVSKNEIHSPLYFDLAKTCKFIKVSVPPMKKLRSAFRHFGYDISSSHTDAQHYKTNAPWSSIYDILKLWKLTYVSNIFQGVKEGSSAHNVLSKAIVLESPNWDLELTESESAIYSIVRFPPNPVPNWGPMARANKNAPSEDPKASAEHTEDQ
jgi:tRNA (guanine26-N2/guanine27-N2)-dimethyltransferase